MTFDRIAGNLQHYMDVLSARQKAVASNLANLDTPGYKTKDVDFQFEFLSRLGAAPGAGPRPHVIEPELASKNDGNNVSLDREARLLAETSLRFQMASAMAASRIQSVKYAIEEGKNG